MNRATAEIIPLDAYRARKQARRARQAPMVMWPAWTPFGWMWVVAPQAQAPRARLG